MSDATAEARKGAGSGHGPLFLFLAAFVVLRLVLACGVPVSAGFNDDYDYMYQSIHFLDGNWTRADYPFSKVSNKGPIYPLLISPYLIASTPAAKTFVVFVINALLSAVTVLFATLTVWKATGKRALWVAPVFALLAATFHFGFYAMPENLLFALLAVLTWLVTDIDFQHDGRLKIAGLVGCTVLLTLTRDAGLAVVPALALIIWGHYRQRSGLKAVAVAGCYVALMVLPYLAVSRLLGSTRLQLSYLRVVPDVLAHPAKLAVGGCLAGWGLNQLLYLAIGGGFLVLPVMLLAAGGGRRFGDSAWDRKKVQLTVFSLVSAAVFVAFCLLHLSKKLQFNPERWSFIYGRYDDPALLLLLMLGVCVLLSVEDWTRGRILAIQTGIVASLALFLVLHGSRIFPPVNENGLALFAIWPPARYPAPYAAAGLTALLLALAATGFRRATRTALVAIFITYNIYALTFGYLYTRNRSRLVLHAVEAADWISRHTGPEAAIGLDGAVKDNPAPGSIKEMSNVYRALGVLTHPRKISLVDFPDPESVPPDRRAAVDYYFSMRELAARSDLVPVWQNRDYRLYRVAPSL